MCSGETHSRKEGPRRPAAFQCISHGAWLALLTPTVLGHDTAEGPASREKEMPGRAARTTARPCPAHLMGMMLENKRRKRMICRYQRPAKCCRATMTSDTTTRAPKRILVRQFTSRSNRPIWGQDGGPEVSWRAARPEDGPSPVNPSPPRGGGGARQPLRFWLRTRGATDWSS